MGNQWNKLINRQFELLH